MEGMPRSSVPKPNSTTATTVTPPPPGDTDGSLHVGLSLAISCIGMIVVPILTFILFWVVYRATQKRKLKKLGQKNEQKKQQFRRTRLKELQEQEMTEKEKKDTTPQGSPRVHHGTRIHFDNVTVNIQVMHCQYDDEHQGRDAYNASAATTKSSGKARWASSPIFHHEDDMSLYPSPFTGKSKSANLLGDHESSVFWGPDARDFYQLPAKLLYDRASGNAAAEAGLGTNRPAHSYPPSRRPPQLTVEDLEAATNYTQMPSTESPPHKDQLQDVSDTSGSLHVEVPVTVPAHQEPPAHTVPLYTTSRTAYAARGRHLPYVFNTNTARRSGKTDLPPGGTPCTLRWLSSVDVRRDAAKDDETVPLLLSTGVDSKLIMGSRSQEGHLLAIENETAKTRGSALSSDAIHSRGGPRTLGWETSSSGRSLPSSGDRLGGPGHAQKLNKNPTIQPTDNCKMTAATPPQCTTLWINPPTPADDGNKSSERSDYRRHSDKSSTSSGAPSVELKTDPRSLTILESLQTVLDAHHTTRLNVCRTEVLQSFLRVIQKSSFDPSHALVVRFVGSSSDHQGSGHHDKDVSEFFRLLLLEISQMEILEGPSGEKTIAYSAKALDSELYEHCGCLLAMSLVHGGPPPQFFSSGAYDTMCSRPDGLLDANAGQCWKQFLSGLSTLGVLEAIRLDPEAMRPYFQTPEVTLRAEHVEAIFVSIDFSPGGSTGRAQQERAVSYFWDFLVEVEEGLSTVSLRDVLFYITASPLISSLGYSAPPRLSFSEERRPQVDRTNNVLTLPLLPDYGVFKKVMEEAIEKARI